MRMDMKENQLDLKIAQNIEAWRNAIMAIDPERVKNGKGKQRRDI